MRSNEFLPQCIAMGDSTRKYTYPPKEPVQSDAQTTVGCSSSRLNTDGNEKDWNRGMAPTGRWLPKNHQR